MKDQFPFASSMVAPRHSCGAGKRKALAVAMPQCFCDNLLRGGGLLRHALRGIAPGRTWNRQSQSFAERPDLRALILVPFLVFAPSALAAQSGGPDMMGEAEGRDAADPSIVVVATRIRGQVETELPPVMTLDEGDITAYGASGIGDLITAVSPQTSSGRGRGGGHPVILLNGQRISSFRILRNIPPEAIRRMEVLPEEVAQRFGYPPNQRLINFILKDDYASKTLAGEYNAPTRGGFANWEAEGGYLSIDGPRRFNLDAKLVEDSMLTEGERGVLQAPDVIPTVAGDPDPAAFRSLVDALRTITVNASWSMGLGKDGLNGTLAVDGGYTRVDRRGLSGLNTVLLTAPGGSSQLRSIAGPLASTMDSDKFEAGFALNKPIGSWQLSATLDSSYAERLRIIDREMDLSALVANAATGTLDIAGPLPALTDPGADRARSREFLLTSLVTLTGSSFRLPAGDASLTLNAGYSFDRVRSSDTRSGAGVTRLSRGDLSAGANIVLPVTSRDRDVAGGLGDVSLSFSAGLDRLSDFGTLTDWSAGLTWTPIGPLSLQASYIVSETAPTLAQLGDPQTVTLNVPVYDFSLGAPALVTIVNGGNPGLVAEKQRDIKLSANWQLPFLRRSSLLVEYFRNASDDVTQSFPLLTPAIEAAFPSRVVRGPSGPLVSIDRRPVTFDKIESSRLRWGFNLHGRISATSKPGESSRSGEGSPPRSEGAGAKRPGRMAFGHGARRGGRWNLSAYHTIRFTDRVTIAPGAAPLDQLAGDAILAGGVPRHSLELEGGAFYQGMGLRLKGNWDAPAKVRSSGAPGSSDLRFGGLLRLDARLFINLGMRQGLVDKAPFFKGLRLAFDVQNLLDARQKVTDANGAVPLAYQPNYRDPRGRIVGVDLRKMF
jgi:outer membrane receptor protein involved in Fe transport